jgi:uncharacterized membrane protein
MADRGGAISSVVNLHIDSLWGLIVLVADIWAIVNIILSLASTGRKVLWTVLVLLLPVFGFIIWFFAGPRRLDNSRGAANANNPVSSSDRHHQIGASGAVPST